MSSLMISQFGVCEVPHPKTLMKLIAEVAKYHFLCRPALAIAEIKSGIPDVHLPYGGK